MPVNDSSFFQYKETRALSGYKSAWLVKDNELGKYCLVGATETVPYVFGDKETHEYNLLQAPTKGQVEGKMSLESQDIEVLHHRDNAYRYGKLKEKGILDFMVINAEFVGYKFVGTLDYRPNNAEADVNRATVTITPMSADTVPIFNVRNEVVETLCFKSSIPSTIKVGEKIDLSVLQLNAPTITAKKIADGTNEESDATASINSTTVSDATITAEGLYAITVSDPAKSYAPWTTTVYVESEA
jgi:hypothetical protein